MLKISNAVLFRCINPLPPEPAMTGCAKTIPQMPVLTVTACKKACEDNNNCLSYPPRRLFDFPVVLLLSRTNKPMSTDFLSIFFEDFMAPRKMFFCLRCNENLILLNLLLHFFHLLACIWEVLVLKVNNNLHVRFLHMQFMATSTHFNLFT